MTLDEHKIYLGDAVYAKFDGIHLVLQANGSGSEASDTIYLDNSVIDALLRYIKRLQDAQIIS